MKFVCKSLICLMFVVTVFVSDVEADAKPSIIIVTSRNIPVTTNNTLLEVTYLDLDAANAIESKLGLNLPANKQKAEALVRQRIKEYGQSKLEEDIREAYSAIAFVMRLGIDRYPAIVFDNQFVVYGVTNLSEAYDYYEKWNQDQEDRP